MPRCRGLGEVPKIRDGHEPFQPRDFHVFVEAP
jgi:hypothetical protein